LSSKISVKNFWWQLLPLPVVGQVACGKILATQNTCHCLIKD